MKRFLCAGERYALCPTNINYRTPRYFPAWRAPLLLVFSFFMCLEALVAGEPDLPPVKGVVKFYAIDKPVEGALVQEIGSEHYTFTDQFGNFSLNRSMDTGTIQVSFHGYVPLTRGFDTNGLQKGSHLFILQKDLAGVPLVFLGEQIPDFVWDLPLDIINHPKDRSIVTLREYKQAPLLVLDFWTTYCAPCVKGIDQWESLPDEILDQIAFLTVHVDMAHRAAPFIQRKGWRSPAIVGENHRLLNHFFFNRYQLGGVVFIRDGKLYSIPQKESSDIIKLQKLLAGQEVQYDLNIRSMHQKERRDEK